MLEFKAHIAPDKKTATLEFPDSPPSMTMQLTAEAMDELIMQLAKIRMMLQPEPPAMHDQSKPFTASEFPSWWVDKDLMRGFPALHLRHAGFGWVHFLIDHPVAIDIGNWLVKFGQDGPASTPADPKQKN